MKQYENTAAEIARSIYEKTFDMDFLDYSETSTQELNELENEIQDILDNYKNLGAALDLLTSLDVSNYEVLVDRLIDFNGG